jgi:hypothetical protein
MNKVIAVFLLFFLNSCAPSHQLDGRRVDVVGPTIDKPNEVYQYYMNKNPYKYKVFGEIVNGPWGGRGYYNWGGAQTSLEDAIQVFHRSSSAFCTQGCILTHIGNEKISLEKQIEIAKRFYPDATVTKLFSNKNNTTVEKPDSKIDGQKKYDWLNKYNDNDIIPAGSGTGFFISREGTLLTNYHVVQGCTSVALYHTGVKYPSSILASDRTNDLAILNSSKKSNQYFKVNKDGPELLEEIFVAGYPLGLKVSNSLKVSGGRVSSLAGYGDNYSNFQIDAAMNPGNSGGPIINKKGNVVGIAVAQLTDVQGFNFGIKSSTANSFVNSNKIYFSSPNMTDMSSRDLSKLMNEATVFLECSMRVKDIKAALANKDSKKVFYSEFNNKN